MSVIAGLNKACVSRLKNTFKELGGRSMKVRCAFVVIFLSFTLGGPLFFSSILPMWGMVYNSETGRFGTDHDRGRVV